MCRLNNIARTVQHVFTYGLRVRDGRRRKTRFYSFIPVHDRLPSEGKAIILHFDFLGGFLGFRPESLCFIVWFRPGRSSIFNSGWNSN
ncbi:hypothetical protein D3C71_1716300 [compost metagenome]